MSAQPRSHSAADEMGPLLQRLGVRKEQITDGPLAVHSPISGECVARLQTTSASAATDAIDKAHAAFLEWRKVPAPRRGELVRLLGEERKQISGGSLRSKRARSRAKASAKCRK